MNELEGQLNFVDVGLWSGRTSQEPCQAESHKERTSKRSSKRSVVSSAKKPPLFLSLMRGGPEPDASMAWETTVSPFPWHGESMMLSSGASRSVDGVSAYWLTSTGLRRQGYCLTLNLSERPREANHSRLSEILETDPDQKYRLSARACQGILNRAARRGKPLPKELEEALRAQSSELTNREEKEEETIQSEFPQPLPETVTEHHTQSASKNEPGNLGGQGTTLAE